MRNMAFWMSTPHVGHAEIARELGFDSVVLDIEHGTFDLDALDRYIPLLKGLGLRVCCKVLGPTTEAVQQVLDFGCDAVIIPHIGGIEHARAVTAAAKYPPVGLRSYSGGRVSGYKPTGADYAARKNAEQKCWPMIESAEAFADVEKIAALPTVDGLFLGPTDLSVTRGRERYSFSPDDRADLDRIVAAAKTAGKPWIFPAWTAPEREYAKQHGAELVICAPQYGVIRGGFNAIVESLKKEGFA